MMKVSWYMISYTGAVVLANFSRVSIKASRELIWFFYTASSDIQTCALYLLKFELSCIYISLFATETKSARHAWYQQIERIMHTFWIFSFAAVRNIFRKMYFSQIRPLKMAVNVAQNCYSSPEKTRNFR